MNGPTETETGGGGARRISPLEQWLRYAFFGGLATAVDMAAFYAGALTWLPALAPDDPVVRLLALPGPFAAEMERARNFVINRCVAFLFSNLTAYVTNVRWVFGRGRHRRELEVALFYVVSACSLAVGTGIGWSLIHLGGLSTTVSYLGNVVAAMLFNYVCRKYIVFRA